MPNFQYYLKNGHYDKDKLVIVEEDDVRRIQMKLLETLDDVLDICNKEHIPYQLSGGSALGAVRHKGFIPWDDDIDINMSRVYIDSFLNAFKNTYGDKYWIHVPGETPDYDLLMIHIMRKDVRARELMNPDHKECGLNFDIFIVENTFDNKLMRGIHGLGCMAFRYALSCIRFKRNNDELKVLFKDDKKLKEYMNIRARIGRILLIIPLSWWTKIASKWVGMCKNAGSKYVVITAGTHQFFKELYEREPFCQSVIKEYEGREVYVTADFDNYLSALYGDYMAIPPENRREKHIMLELDTKALKQE